MSVARSTPAMKSTSGDIPSRAAGALRALLSARQKDRENTVLRTRIYRQRQPLRDDDMINLARSANSFKLPTCWEDVEWVMDDEGVILEDLRVQYECFGPINASLYQDASQN